MQFQNNGITVSVEEAEIRRLVLERFGESRRNPYALGTIVVPRIGTEWHSEGGIYAGIARGRDGAPDYHLIAGPAYDGSLDHPEATKWAAGVTIDGHSDFTLPFRKEQSLAFANVAELFKAETYWSCEQPASDSSYAWLQLFHDGTQHYWRKVHHLLARAVRRLKIQ